MPRTLSFVYLDGRDIEASTPCGVIEALRAGEPNAPLDLDRYLDFLCRRGAVMFGVALDVGIAESGLEVRCRRALSSLLQNGWLRAKAAAPVWPPRERRPLVTPPSPPGAQAGVVAASL